jgi:hypothetical protein
MLLALIVPIGTPVWFIGASLWNPDYVPVTGFVWSVPWILAFAYLVVQIIMLLNSAGQSDNIGMADTIVSGVAFISTLLTFAALIMLSRNGEYNLGQFQTSLALALLLSSLSELIITAWMRFLVNRRYFAGVPSGGGDHHNQGQ